MAKKPKKIYLQVETRLTSEGWKLPNELKYNDETFEIKNPIKSMKLFDGAIRWRCKVDGQDTEMFNIDDQWWMIDSTFA